MRLNVLGALIAMAWIAPRAAFAQSAVSLYGIIEEGVDYVNNSGGHSLVQLRDGTYAGTYGSRWGLKGTEDLGGGMSVIFRLENGFSLENGQLRQGGLEFGRQAYVGLSDQRFGTVTFGRQYDSVVDYLQEVIFPWGGLFVHGGDIDNTANSFRVNNAIKYASPTIGGLRFGAMYAFSNVNGPGTSTTGMYSAGADYTIGGLTLGAAYFYAKKPGTLFADGDFGPNTQGNAIGNTGPFSYVGQPDNERIMGVAANYVLGKTTVGLDYTNTRFADANGTTHAVTFQNFDAWMNYAITADLILGADYTFTLGNINYNGQQPKYHQAGFIANYSLSKRTSFYLSTVYQRAAGSAPVAVVFNGAVGDPSTTRSQLAARLAMVHKF